jgi:hypothetical protein
MANGFAFQRGAAMAFASLSGTLWQGPIDMVMCNLPLIVTFTGESAYCQCAKNAKRCPAKPTR